MQLSFRQWLLVEGGNIKFGDDSADKIDLHRIERAAFVKTMKAGLKAISDKFKTMHERPIWSNTLLRSNEFLSGSSLHLFSNDISDEDFIKHKPLVGDIDTQVDETMQDQIDNFLKSLSVGSMVGELKFLGFKKTDQFITLWRVENFGINVQIDLELVEYKNDKPSTWSIFSHSSDWGDIKKGIKGVFHKFLMRAFQARSARDVIIQPKTPRGKEKIISKSDLAFSLKGLRKRLEPVLDEKGKHLYKDGLPVYTELDSTNANYETDLSILFSSFFGVDGSKSEIHQMGSFDGLIQLMKKYMTKAEQRKVVDGFANVLWEKGAQGLVRANPDGDREVKMTAFNYLLSQIGGSISSYKKMMDEYYAAYKMK